MFSLSPKFTSWCRYHQNHNQFTILKACEGVFFFFLGVELTINVFICLYLIMKQLLEQKMCFCALFRVPYLSVFAFSRRSATYEHIFLLFFSLQYKFSASFRYCSIMVSPSPLSENPEPCVRIYIYIYNIYSCIYVNIHFCSSTRLY